MNINIKSILYREESNDKVILVILGIFTFALLFFCSTLSPLYPISQWSDVNLYFNIGKAIFNGQVLYTEVFDHKGPLIFIIYGIGYIISNDSFFGMYFIQSIGWLVMVYYAYYTARMFLCRIYSFLVALAFPVLLLSHTIDGGSADEFVTIFMVVSLFYFIHYFKDKSLAHKPKHMFIHGLMGGVVMLIKINLMVFWIFPLLVILFDLFRQKNISNLMLNIAAYLLGMLAICLPILIYLMANGALAEAFDTYIVLNKDYAKVGNMTEVLGYLVIRFYQRFRFDRLEFLIITIGAFYFPFRYLANKIGRVGILLSFVSLYTIIFMTPNFIYYYAVPYYIFAILGCIAVAQFIKRFISIKYVWHICLSFAFVAVFFSGTMKGFFGYAADELVRGKKTLSIENQFGAIIDKEPNPTLLNLGLDLGNTVFTQSNIMPNVKYFISPNLPYRFYPQMRDEQTKYIENSEVQFIILALESFNFEYFKELPALNENYTIVSEFIEYSNIDNYKFDKVYYLYKRNN